MQSTLLLVAAADAAVAMLDPVRRRLLEQFREPRSAAEVSRRLELPRQRVGHHVRLLRDRGLLQAAGERRTGNFVEQLLQTSARAYVIAPQALGELGKTPEEARDRFSSEYLAWSAARTLRDLTMLRQQADAEDKRVATLTLETEVCFADPRSQAAFAEELAEALAGLVRKHHDADSPTGRRYRFMVGGYPACPVPRAPHEEEEEEDDE